MTSFPTAARKLQDGSDLPTTELQNPHSTSLPFFSPFHSAFGSTIPILLTSQKSKSRCLRRNGLTMTSGNHARQDDVCAPAAGSRSHDTASLFPAELNRGTGQLVWSDWGPLLVFPPALMNFQGLGNPLFPTACFLEGR